VDEGEKKGKSECYPQLSEIFEKTWEISQKTWEFFRKTLEILGGQCLDIKGKSRQMNGASVKVVKAKSAKSL